MEQKNSDDYQADISRSDSTEKFNLASNPQRYTRRAPHMERYVEVRPVVVEDFPDAHLVFLKVGNQGFSLDHGGCGYFETRKEAEWTMDMLCIALDRMVRDCQGERTSGPSDSADRLKSDTSLKDSEA